MKIEELVRMIKGHVGIMLNSADDVELVVSALEKQIPKEPIKKDTTDHFCFVCPECGHGVWGAFAKAVGCTSTYCQDCGKRLK
jgi:hypothetical protein